MAKKWFVWQIEKISQNIPVRGVEVVDSRSDSLGELQTFSDAKLANLVPPASLYEENLQHYTTIITARSVISMTHTELKG